MGVELTSKFTLEWCFEKQLPETDESLCENSTITRWLMVEDWSFFQRSGTRQQCLLLSILFNITLEVLGMAVRQENGIKVIYIKKEGVKLSHMIQFYVKKS